MLGKIATTITGYTHNMKAAHFIMNSDFITPQNEGMAEVSVALPSSFYVPKYQNQVFSASVSIPGSASQDYRCYFTSTAFNYAITGCYGGQLRYGNDNLIISLVRSKDAFTLRIWNPAETENKTFSGTGQVITAHIQAFKDPFVV